MNFYNTSTREPNPMGPVKFKHQPFTIYTRVVPSQGYGRGLEYHKNLDRLASKLYYTITDNLTSADINFCSPFLTTPRFGNMSARITITGFAAPVQAENLPPVTPTATIIHSGTVIGEKTSVMTPVQGTQGWGDKPTSAVIARVSTLKSIVLAADPNVEITAIIYNGAKFGYFPGKTGFYQMP